LLDQQLQSHASLANRRFHGDNANKSCRLQLR
jgi:hypothetical protein